MNKSLFVCGCSQLFRNLKDPRVP